MTSFELDYLVKDRIADRQGEADRERLARIAQASREKTVRPPRGPLFASIGRIASHLVHAA